jgi:hypothetical protein
MLSQKPLQEALQFGLVDDDDDAAGFCFHRCLVSHPARGVASPSHARILQAAERVTARNILAHTRHNGETLAFISELQALMHSASYRLIWRSI